MPPPQGDGLCIITSPRAANLNTTRTIHKDGNEEKKCIHENPEIKLPPVDVTEKEGDCVKKLYVVNDFVDTMAVVILGNIDANVDGEEPIREAKGLEYLLTEQHNCHFDRKRSELFETGVLENITIDELDRECTRLIDATAWITDNNNMNMEIERNWMQCLGDYLNINFHEDTEELPDLVRQKMASKQVPLLRLYQITDITFGSTPHGGDIKTRLVILHKLLQTVELSMLSMLKSVFMSKQLAFTEEVNMALPLNMGFSWPVFAEASPNQQFISHILTTILRRNLRRVVKGTDADCYHEITVNGHNTRAWKKIHSIEEFIYENSSKDQNPCQWKQRTSSAENCNQALQYLIRCQDHEFPDLMVNREYISFRNGVYHINGDTFYAFTGGIELLDNSIVSMSFIDQDFDSALLTISAWQDIPTPYVDTIFRHQGYDDETLEWVYAFLGRLLYAVGDLDNWQVGMFIKGIAGSGKSTIADLVKSIFPPRAVGTLSSNGEVKFGLQNLYDKLIYVCSEVKKNLTLDQGDWQSMISGEEVSVAIKGETAVSVKWTAPGLLCGNELPNWVDASGSVVRRLVLFEFQKKVSERNTHLSKELQQNIAAFVLKINKAYIHMAELYGKVDIWGAGVLSEQLIGFHHELKREVNSLVSFIESDSIVLSVAATSYVLEKDFVRKYKKFRSDNGYIEKVKCDYQHFVSVFDDYNITDIKDEREYPVGSGRQLYGNYLVGLTIQEEEA